MASQWTCQLSGDCCRHLSSVAMTEAEMNLLLLRRPDLRDRFSSLREEGFWSLAAAPCPLLDLQTNRCTVYDIRPYNCRRWGCFRPEPAKEPFVPRPDWWGCQNFFDRFHASRAVRRAAVLMQRKAQRWARSMGWRE